MLGPLLATFTNEIKKTVIHYNPEKHLHLFKVHIKFALWCGRISCSLLCQQPTLD